MSATKLKELSSAAIGFGAFALLLFLSIWIIKGAVWLGDYVYPAMQVITNIALTIAFFICLPLAIFKKMRFYCAIGILIAAYVSGLDLWVNSLITTYVIWGWVGVLVGFITGGIGMIPVSLIATMVDGQWGHFGGSIFALLITIILFVLSIWIGSKSEE